MDSIENTTPELTRDDLAVLADMVQEAEAKLGVPVDPRDLMNLWVRLGTAVQGQDTVNGPGAMRDTIMNALYEQSADPEVQVFIDEHGSPESKELYQYTKKERTKTSIIGVFDRELYDAEVILDETLMALDGRFGPSRVRESGYTSTIEDPDAKKQYTYVVKSYSLGGTKSSWTGREN